MQSLDAWRLWRTWLQATKRPDTVRSYTGNVLRFLAETGARAVAAYDEDVCTSFFSTWVDRGRAKYEYAKALNSFFRWCVRRGFLEANPMEFVPMRKPRRARAVALTEEELVRVIVAATLLMGERVAWGLLLVYLLALRRVEAAGLRWEDIRAGESGPVIEIRETKGAFGRDPQPLSPLALECLARLRELPVPPQVRRGPEYVLRVKRATISDWMHRAATAAGLDPKKTKAHRLRTSMATHMLRAGVDVRAVKAALGHLDLTSTNWYAEDADEREVRAALGVVSRRLGPAA